MDNPQLLQGLVATGNHSGGPAEDQLLNGMHAQQSNNQDGEQRNASISATAPVAQEVAANRCQADGCLADLSGLRRYFRRYHVCETHMRAEVVKMSGRQMRFCDQCSTFHPLSLFDGTRRTCREKLEHNRMKRRLRKAQGTGGAPQAAGGGSQQPVSGVSLAAAAAAVAAAAAAAGGALAGGGNQSDDADSDDQPGGMDGEDGGPGSPKAARGNGGGPPGRGKVRKRQSMQSLAGLRRQLPAPRQGAGMDVTRAAYGGHQQQRGGSGSPEADVDEPDRRGEPWGLAYPAGGVPPAMVLGGAAAGPEALLPNGGILVPEADSGAPQRALTLPVELNAPQTAAVVAAEWVRHAHQDLRDQEAMPPHVFTLGPGVRTAGAGGRPQQWGAQQPHLVPLPPLPPPQQPHQFGVPDEWHLEDRRRAGDMAAVERIGQGGPPGVVARRPHGGSAPNIPQDLPPSPVLPAGEGGPSRATWPSIPHGPGTSLLGGNPFQERSAMAAAAGHQQQHQHHLHAQAPAGVGTLWGPGAARLQAGAGAEMSSGVRSRALSAAQMDDAALGALDTAAALGIPLSQAHGERGYGHDYGYEGPSGAGPRSGLVALMPQSKPGLGAGAEISPGPAGTGLALHMEAGVLKPSGAGAPGGPNRQALVGAGWHRQQQQPPSPPLQQPAHHHAGVGGGAEAAAPQQQEHGRPSWMRPQAAALGNGHGAAVGGQVLYGEDGSLFQAGEAGAVIGPVIQQPMSPGSSIYSADEEATRGAGLDVGGTGWGAGEVEMVLSDAAAAEAAAFARDWTERELDALAAAGQDVGRLPAGWHEYGSIGGGGGASGHLPPQQRLQHCIHEMQHVMAHCMETYQLPPPGHLQDMSMPPPPPPSQQHQHAPEPDGSGQMASDAILETDSFKQEVFMLQEAVKKRDDQYRPRMGLTSSPFGRPHLQHAPPPAPPPQPYQPAAGPQGLGASHHDQLTQPQPCVYGSRAYAPARQPPPPAAPHAPSPGVQEEDGFTAFRAQREDLDTDDSPPVTARGRVQHYNAPSGPAAPGPPHQYPYPTRHFGEPYAPWQGRHQPSSQRQEPDYPAAQHPPTFQQRILGMQYGRAAESPSRGAETLVLKVPSSAQGFHTGDEPTPTAVGPAAPRWVAAQRQYGSAGQGPGVGAGSWQQDPAWAGPGNRRAGDVSAQQPPPHDQQQQQRQQQHQIFLVAAPGPSSSLPPVGRFGGGGGGGAAFAGGRDEDLPVGRFAHAARSIGPGAAPAQPQAVQWEPSAERLDSPSRADGPLPIAQQQPQQQQSHRLRGFESLPSFTLLQGLSSVGAVPDSGLFLMPADSEFLMQQQYSLGLSELNSMLGEPNRSRRLVQEQPLQLEQAGEEEDEEAAAANARIQGGGSAGVMLPPPSARGVYGSREDGRSAATTAPGPGLQARAGPAGGGGGALWQAKAGPYGNGVERVGEPAWRAARGAPMLQLHDGAGLGGVAGGRGQQAALEAGGVLGSPGGYGVGAGSGGVHSQYGGPLYGSVDGRGGGAGGSRLSHVAFKLSHAPADSLPPDLADRLQGGLRGTAALPPTLREGCIELLVEVLHSGPVASLCDQLFHLPELDDRTPADARAAAAAAARTQLRELVGPAAFDVCERITLQLLGGPVLSCRPGSDPELLTWAEATEQAGVACAASWPDLLLLQTGPPVLLTGAFRNQEVLLYGPPGLRKHMGIVHFGVRMAGGARPLGVVKADPQHDTVEATAASATALACDAAGATETEAWQNPRCHCSPRPAPPQARATEVGQRTAENPAIDGEPAIAAADCPPPEGRLEDVAEYLRGLSLWSQRGHREPLPAALAPRRAEAAAAADGGGLRPPVPAVGVPLAAAPAADAQRVLEGMRPERDEGRAGVGGGLPPALPAADPAAAQGPPALRCGGDGACGGAAGEVVPCCCRASADGTAAAGEDGVVRPRCSGSCAAAVAPSAAAVPYSVGSRLDAGSGGEDGHLPPSCFAIRPQHSARQPSSTPAAPEQQPLGRSPEQRRVLGLEPPAAAPPQPVLSKPRQLEHEGPGEPQHGTATALAPGGDNDTLPPGGSLAGPNGLARRASCEVEGVLTPPAASPRRRHDHLHHDAAFAVGAAPKSRGASSEPSGGSSPLRAPSEQRSPAPAMSTPSTPCTDAGGGAADAAAATSAAVVSAGGDGGPLARLSSRSSASLTIASLYDMLSVRSDWSWTSTLQSSLGHASSSTMTSLYGASSRTGEPLLHSSSGWGSASATGPPLGSRHCSEERTPVPGPTSCFAARTLVCAPHIWASDADTDGGGGGSAAAFVAGNSRTRSEAGSPFTSRTGSRRRPLGLPATEEEPVAAGLEDPGVAVGDPDGVPPRGRLLLHVWPYGNDPRDADAAAAAAAAAAEDKPTAATAAAAAASEPATPVLVGGQALFTQRPPPPWVRSPPVGAAPARRVLAGGGGAAAVGPEVLRLQLPPVPLAGLVLLEVMAGHSVVACWPFLTVETACQQAELAQLWQDMAVVGQHTAWRALAVDLGLVLAHLPRRMASGALQLGLHATVRRPPPPPPLERELHGRKEDDGFAASGVTAQESGLESAETQRDAATGVGAGEGSGSGSEELRVSPSAPSGDEAHSPTAPSERPLSPRSSSASALCLAPRLAQRNSLDNPSYPNSMRSWGTSASHGSSGSGARGASPSLLPSPLTRAESGPTCGGGGRSEAQVGGGGGAGGAGDCDGGVDGSGSVDDGGAGWDACVVGNGRVASAPAMAGTEAVPAPVLAVIADPPSPFDAPALAPSPVAAVPGPTASEDTPPQHSRRPAGDTAPSCRRPASPPPLPSRSISSEPGVAALSRRLERVRLVSYEGPLSDGAAGEYAGGIAAGDPGQEQGQGQVYDRIRTLLGSAAAEGAGQLAWAGPLDEELARLGEQQGPVLPGGPPVLSEAAATALREALSRLRAFVDGRPLPALSELLSRVLPI